MRIFGAFLVLLTAAFLFMLPLTTLVYDFRTDLREDGFDYETAAGVTTGNVTLVREVYDNDTNTIDIVSDESDDTPTFTSYNTTTRRLHFSGLAASENRTLIITYIVDALEENATLNTLMDNILFIWVVVTLAFAPAALVAIFTGRA